MKRIASVTIASLILLLAIPCTTLSDSIYHPFQYYEYYQGDAPKPPPQPPPPGQQPPEVQVETPPPAKKPTAPQQAPEFLFPKELGFGVAVGVPYDMFYLSKAYYLVDGSDWYRSSSHQGPWKAAALSQLPPALLKHDLAKIRELRNREFKEFWQNREHYQGRHFRPESKFQQPRKGKPGGSKKDRRPN